MKKIIGSAVRILVLLSVMMIFVCGAAGLEAKAKTKLQTKSATITVGEKKSLKLYEGKKAVKSKKVKWTSKNKKVAKVSKKGVVTGVSEGTTKIIARYNGKKYKITITVQKKEEKEKEKDKDQEKDKEKGKVVHENVPEDAVLYEGHSYKIYKGVMDWHTAKTECEKVGAHLATVTTAMENAFIGTMIGDDKTKPGFWLGGYRDDDMSKEWKWVTGEPFTFTNWQRPTENPGYGNGELYLEMWNARLLYQWNDLGDHNYKKDWIQGYVCEWEYPRVE